MTGGKSTDRPRLVAVFGGAGFLGRHLVQRLARAGYAVRIGTRRPDQALFLKPMGKVGQIEPIAADIRHPQSCAALMQDASAVVNLVGILQEGGGRRFDEIHADAPARLAQQAAQQGVSRFIHISAIGADPDSPSRYGRSKAAGESRIFEAFPQATVLRPSIIFGPEDDFFNRFAAMCLLAPALPLIGGGATRFQPIHVGDVAQAIQAGIEQEDTAGKIYELGGAEARTFRELLELMLEITRRKRLLLPLPFPLADTLARCIGWLPNAPLTYDQMQMLRRDNVVSEQAVSEGRDAAALGIAPQPLRAILPSYLARFRPAGEFARRPASSYAKK